MTKNITNTNDKPKTLNQIQFARFALPFGRQDISIHQDALISSDYVDLAALKPNEAPVLPVGTPIKIYDDAKFLKKEGLSHIALVRFTETSGLSRGETQHVLAPIEEHGKLLQVLNERQERSLTKQPQARIRVA